MDLATVWNETVEEVKLKVIHPSLWRALEAGVAVTSDDEHFVVGYPAGQMHQAGHLNSTDHRNAIEAAIASRMGKRLRLLVIEGTSLDDWQHYVAKQKAAEASRSKMRDRALREQSASQSWDSTLEQVGRAYAQLNNKQLPQVRARYIGQALQIISAAMDDLCPDGQEIDDVSQRAMARVIDRVGTLTEVPGALIALELMRYRRSRGS